MAEPVSGITAVPDEHNSRYFHVVVAGPSQVVWDFMTSEFLVSDYMLGSVAGLYYPVESDALDKYMFLKRHF